MEPVTVIVGALVVGAVAGVTAVATSAVQDVYAQLRTSVGRLFRRRAAGVDEAGSQGGKYRVDLRGAQGVQVGEHNAQTMTFTSPPTGS
ncbi:MAG: hypothetical protein ACR2GH_04650 [Pseudonocardia sp.]